MILLGEKKQKTLYKLELAVDSGAHESVTPPDTIPGMVPGKGKQKSKRKDEHRGGYHKDSWEQERVDRERSVMRTEMRRKGKGGEMKYIRKERKKW